MKTEWRILGGKDFLPKTREVGVPEESEQVWIGCCHGCGREERFGDVIHFLLKKFEIMCLCWVKEGINNQSVDWCFLNCVIFI